METNFICFDHLPQYNNRMQNSDPVLRYRSRIWYRLQHLRKVGNCMVSFNFSPVFHSQEHATLDPKFGSFARQTYILVNYW